MGLKYFDVSPLGDIILTWTFHEIIGQLGLLEKNGKEMGKKWQVSWNVRNSSTL